MRRCLTPIILLAFGISALLVAGAPPTTYAQFDALIARVKPAVVHVETKAFFGSAGGSGVIYDPSGYILTNDHVINGAASIAVTLPDRRTYPATVVDYMRPRPWTS